MNRLDSLVLKSVFASSLDGSDPAVRIKEKRWLGDDVISEKLDALVQDGLADKNYKITESGRRLLKVVFAGGVFDIIHPGHIHTLRSAGELGDVLVVVVATDKTAKKMKGRAPLHSQSERRKLVGSLVMVDVCLVGDEQDIFKTVSRVRPQVIALGYDQIHQEKFITEGCEKIGIKTQVARLHSPIPETSSSAIEEKYGENIHDT